MSDQSWKHPEKGALTGHIFLITQGLFQELLNGDSRKEKSKLKSLPHTIQAHLGVAALLS